MYSFLKAFLVLMKLLSLSQFYAPKFTVKIGGAAVLQCLHIRAATALDVPE